MPKPANPRVNEALLSFSARPEHDRETSRLYRALAKPDGFNLILAIFNDPGYRDRIIDALESGAARPPLRIDVRAYRDLGELEEACRRQAADRDLVQLTGLEQWLTGEAGRERLHALNTHREAIAALLPQALILWVTEPLVKRFALEAPDLWAWRTATLDFTQEVTPREIVAPGPATGFGELFNLTVAEKRKRFHRLDRYLSDNRTQLEAAEQADLLEEMGRLQAALGGLEQAEALFRKALGRARQAGGGKQIALIHGHIADILYRRGELDEALRIRTEEQLPVYERLGDVRGKAVTQGQIADILQDRGELDEALRIRTEEQLPVYERLGDVRSKAVTQGRIADILYRRGELDEALRIHADEVLPACERLGDVRGKAVTQGKIADILQARGELDEALRIRTEEELPVYERLGAARDRLVCQARIALNLLAFDPPRKDEAAPLLRAALKEAQRLKLPEADRISEILAGNGLATPH